MKSQSNARADGGTLNDVLNGGVCVGRGGEGRGSGLVGESEQGFFPGELRDMGCVWIVLL